MTDQSSSYAEAAAEGCLWPRIKNALADSQFDLRTYVGISKELGIEEDRVRGEITNHLNEVSFSFMYGGDKLFTAREKPKNWRERLSEIRYRFAVLAL